MVYLLFVSYEDFAINLLTSLSEYYIEIEFTVYKHKIQKF